MHFIGIPSGTIIGYYHASIVPASRKSTSTGTTVIPKAVISKTASLIPASKSKQT
ncbi:MAG: hypothetical protein ABR968_10080 [Bacteroidales bacterium]